MEQHTERQAWWEKGKRLVLLTQIGQTIALLGGMLYGSYVIVRNEVREVINNPKRTTVIERKIDSGFAAYDTLHSKQFYITTPNKNSALTFKQGDER